MEHRTEGIILLDAHAGEDATFDADFLERNGHPVVVCNGPDVHRLCPLLGGEGCDKFDAAHGIIVELDLDRAQHRAIVQRYRQLARADLPIRVVVAPEQAERYRDVLEGIETWPHAPTAADLDGFAAEVEASDRTTGT